jgi:site-specific DNA-methyltransferase (adenine-specific)
MTRGLLDTLAPTFATVRLAIEDVDVQEGVFDHVITDPPYAEQVEKRARRGKKTDVQLCEPMSLGFDAATMEKRRRWARWMAIATRRWVAVFSDHESSMDWAAHLVAAGLTYIKCVPWIRTGALELGAEKPPHNGAPQFTGDRPATQHEIIVLAHKGNKTRWNGGGYGAVYCCPVVPQAQRIHPTQKPVPLMCDLLRDFCDAGDRIVDPFAGVGSTLVAAKQLGMAGAVGIELSERYASLATRRAAAAQRFEYGKQPMKG